MNKPTSRKPAKTLTLGDLVLAVSTSSRNSREVVATVADLLDTGFVRLKVAGRDLRAHLAPTVPIAH